MSDIERVVFDCNVYFQALISLGGPAGIAFRAAESRRVHLQTSPIVLAELADVCARPHLTSKFQLTEERITAFVKQVLSCAAIHHDVPELFQYDRDPDDAHYINLALAADAKLVVSRDKDLLALREEGSEDRDRLMQLAPGIKILTPVELIRRL